jgi:hypothetical protein
MSIGKRHGQHPHMSTAPCAYKRVNGVNLSFGTESFSRQLFHQLFEYRRFIDNSVFFRRSGYTPSSPDRPLDSVRSRNHLALA